MTRNKALQLAIGILLGLFIAVSLGEFLWHRQSASQPSSPEPQDQGTSAAAQLSPEEQQKIGVEFTEIRRESLTGEIFAIGRVAEAESAVRVVSTRYAGRIDHLFINFAGQPVQIGDPIASITITGQPTEKDEITINSTVSGIVRTRKVSEGQFVNPGDVLVELTDPGSIWVLADVFDTDIARIRPGLTAQITSDVLPNTKLRGVVTSFDPHSDTQARTTPVRIQLENPGTRLRPGMVVQTSFQLPPTSVLTVPQTAVIDTGMNKMVYVAHDNGVFERRNIHVGVPVKDRYPVVDGLKSGDKVVTNGAFLIDSQTRLTGGLTGMFGGSKSFTETPVSSGSTKNAFKMTFKFDPDPPQGAKQNTIHVALVDAAGRPVSDAQIRLTFTMPAMPAMNMPEMRNSAELKWTGVDYTGPIQIIMAGGWNVAVEARRGNELLTTVQTHVHAR